MAPAQPEKIQCSRHRADALADGTTTSGEVTASVANTFGYNYKWENILTYNFNINDDHEFTLTGVTSWNHNRQEYSYSYLMQLFY